MSEFIWPLTAITLSVIWAYAWVTAERIKYGPDDNEAPEEEE